MSGAQISSMFGTVEATNGQVYIGSVVRDRGLEGIVRIFTGKRGRPVTLFEDEVLEILPVNSNNPNIEK